jgi:predicted  nucleic acid-binding Zn-ribbon protein
MNAAIQNLLKLQALEFGEETGKSVETQIAQLRSQVPSAILGHYDRLRVRGKKGVAVVRNHVCTGCHMQQPIGKITVLMRDEDLQLCDTCGRYLYLLEGAESEFVERIASAKPIEVVVEKPAPKPRRRKEPKTVALATA